MANNIEELIIRLNDQVTGRLNGISNSLNGVRNASNNVNGGFGKLRISGAAIGTAVAAGAAVAIGALTKIGSASLDTSIKVDGLKRQLAFSLGGAKEMGDMWGYIYQRSQELGSSFETNIENISKLAGATKGLLNMKELQTVFEGSAMAAQVLGINSEKLNLIYSAFGQMIGKGTVQMEELKGQLGDSFPGAMQLAAEAMGKTYPELIKLIEAGKVGGKEFVMAFNTKAIEKFESTAKDASKTIQSNFNRVKNTLFSIQTMIGDTISPMINKLTLQMSGYFEFIQTNFNKIKEVFAPLSSFITEVFKAFEDGFKRAFADVSLQDAFNRIGTFFKNIEPWMKILLTYYKLVANAVAFVARGLYEVFHVVGAVIKGLTVFLKGSYGVLMSIFQPIYDFLTTKLIPVFSGVRTFFEDLFGWVKGIASTIVGLIEKIPVLGDSVKAMREGLKTKDFFPKEIQTTGSPLNVFNKLKGSNSPLSKATPTGAPMGSGVDTISGSAPKVVNISIDKIFNGGMDITTNTFGESVTKIKEELTKALLSSINDVNLIGG